MKKNYENPIIEVLELVVETADDTISGNTTDINPGDDWWNGANGAA